MDESSTPPTTLCPVGAEHRAGLVALLATRKGRWVRLSASAPRRPDDALHQIAATVAMAAVAVDEDQAVVGFCSLYGLTGHQTGFIEAEVGDGPDAGPLRSAMLTLAVTAFARDAGLRKVFLRWPAGCGAPPASLGPRLECVLPESVYADGSFEDLHIYGVGVS